jgi:hypothetical protein
VTVLPTILVASGEFFTGTRTHDRPIQRRSSVWNFVSWEGVTGNLSGAALRRDDPILGAPDFCGSPRLV